MHVVLALLGAVVTILILVNRLSENGLDIGWLNPFAWKRRREWAAKYHANPVFSIQSPMEVTALLMVAMAKSEGEMSAEQKRAIIAKFREVFHLDEAAAAGLLKSSAFLLKDDVEVVRDVPRLLEPSIGAFTLEQAMSAAALIAHIANLDSPASPFQREVIQSFKEVFRARSGSSAEWA